MRIDIAQNNVFFCSDPHYHHKSIVKGVTNWEGNSECRDFDTLEEHDNTLVNNINNTVGENDTLFCLGDWSFGAMRKQIVCKRREFRDRINCKNIYFVIGNHDRNIRKNTDNVREIFSDVYDYLEVTFVEPYTGTEQGIKAFKQKVIMMHYPIRSWNHIRQGSWMLHGHCHSNLPDFVINGNIQKTIDVGFDAHPEFRPFSYSEVKEIMDKRKIFTEDHH